MSIVKVKTKGQLTLPNELRKQAGLAVGDLLKATIEHGNIVLKPQTLIDRRLAEGLADITAGREYGPFHSAEDMITDLHKRIRKQHRKTKRST